MLLKIINFRRKQPRRRSDLRRLLRYLFTPHQSVAGAGARLLGAPQLHKLVLSAMPWSAAGIRDAASQLTQQMDRYCRAARPGQPLPDVWYVHIIVSFPPGATGVLRVPVDPHEHITRWRSPAQNAYRITRDVLEFFGWTQNRPSLFVAHGDRRHVHVHVVAVLPVFNDEDWAVLRLSRRQLDEVAKICAEAFSIPLASRAAHKHHQKWEDLLDWRSREVDEAGLDPG
ncbi:relaxase/mobilization nuclease domain-containing protein [Roseateles sp.]|uniref:relaxase/mobilization nuclease domain-containing protein n=1 Tax=Roseateles sp. TaxID=1971397 RepID=UPI003BADBBDA